MGNKQIKETYYQDPNDGAESPKLTPDTIKDLSRSEIIRLNRLQKQGLFTSTLWKKAKREKEEADLPQVGLFRQISGGYFEPTSKSFNILQRYRRISMLYVDVAQIMKKHEEKVQNLESNDDTAKHLRTLKMWLLAQHKKSQIFVSLFTLAPSILYLFFSKRSFFIKTVPLGLAFLMREQLTILHLQRKFLNHFNQLEQRLTGESQSMDTFDKTKSELAAEFREYLKKEEEKKQVKN